MENKILLLNDRLISLSKEKKLILIDKNNYVKNRHNYLPNKSNIGQEEISQLLINYSDFWYYKYIFYASIALSLRYHDD